MEKLIVFFTPEDKKNKQNQFHVEAKGVTDAIEELKKDIKFKAKIMGVACFRGESNGFINRKFY